MAVEGWPYSGFAFRKFDVYQGALQAAARRGGMWSDGEELTGATLNAVSLVLQGAPDRFERRLWRQYSGPAYGCNALPKQP